MRQWLSFGFHTAGVLSVFVGAVYGIYRYLAVFGWRWWETLVVSAGIVLFGMVFAGVAFAIFLPKRDE